MELPKKITPCPIIEAIVEIRFDSKFANEVLIGKLYDFASKNFKGIEIKKLPIMQIPEAILSSDANLRFQPYYKLESENFIFQFGSHIVTLSNAEEYIGWELFYNKLLSLFAPLVELKIFDNVLRLGIRYINFFEFDIFKKITLEVKMNDKMLDSPQLLTRAILECGKFKGTLQVASKAQVVSGQKNLTGSVIDIDISIENINDFSVSLFKQMVSDGHAEEKKLFFEMLQKDFLITLNPEY